MEESLRLFAGYVATFIEGAAILVVAIGAAEALLHIATRLLLSRSAFRTRREIWTRFAGWIILGLEFTLGADIVRTAIAPTWQDIGQLGAIAAIRTALNFFLERDLQEERELPVRRAPSETA